ncbi:hypothetical protein CVT25_000998 [Psilocybe cyanescens]|uniref:PPM-type phosphatase domain-containing protein n=1 Tax=Psilocybe cyanescens TaxID=93625 RepID=A0A409XMI7_PSICY|nr:hypothetical protein CVT25_000998 [Psilocybe cyanescens]
MAITDVDSNIMEAALSNLRKIVDPRQRTSVIGFYNTEDRSLCISMTGDSRVVLGRQVRNDSTSSEQRTARRSYVYKTDILTGEISLPDPSESAVVSGAEPIITYREGIQLGDFVVGASKAFGTVLQGRKWSGCWNMTGCSWRKRMNSTCWIKTRD